MIKNKYYFKLINLIVILYILYYFNVLPSLEKASLYI